MKKLFKCFLINAILSNLILFAKGVIFSEIYIKPNQSTSRDQWIELYNPGENDVDLHNYRIQDEEGSYASITDWTFIITTFDGLSDQITNSTLLSAGGFGVVFDNDFTNGEEILSKFPPNTLLLTVRENSLKGENTIKTSDALFLLDENGRLIDVYGTPGAEDAVPILEIQNGRSIERVFDDESDLEKNWGLSIGEMGHSIGATNTLTLNYNREPAVAFSLNPAFVTGLKQKEVIGRSLPLEIYAITRDGKISFAFDEKVYLEYFDDLKISDDSYVKNKITRGKLLSFECLAGRCGRFLISSIYPGLFEIKVSGGGLEASSTHLQFDNFKSDYVEKVTISEVMYLSTTATNIAGQVYDELDWIEIYNNSEVEIDIHNWFLVQNQNSSFLLPNVSLKKRSHLLLVANLDDFNAIYDPGFTEDIVVDKVEVGFGNLSQSGDIILLDSDSNEVDILQYTDSYIKEKNRYGQKNNFSQYLELREFISLERKSVSTGGLLSFNWGSSSYQLSDVSFVKTSSGVSDSYTLPILATPGFANSRVLLDSKKLNVEILKKVYILDKNSERQLQFEVIVNTPSLIEARIHSQTGAYLGTLETEIIGNENHITPIFFNGLLNGRPLGMGLYFLIVKAIRSDTGEHTSDKMYFAVK